MVYLGPIIPRPQPVKTPVRPTRITPVTAYASDAHGADVDAATVVVGPPEGRERRKEDRRNKSSDPMLETRAGRDRRKAKQAPPINISI